MNTFKTINYQYAESAKITIQKKQFKIILEKQKQKLYIFGKHWVRNIYEYHSVTIIINIFEEITKLYTDTYAK